MNKYSKFLASAAIGLAALSMTSSATASADSESEKCYGVTKAGSNDCGSKTNGHSCAGQSKTDSDANEFIALPKGLCERLTGGALSESGVKAN
jgi:uncharacterized membrane protein